MDVLVPRYLPKRSLPAYAFLPGRTPRPPVAIENPGGACELLGPHNWHVHVEYLWGVDLYNTGFAWEAHEAWESLWRNAPTHSTERLHLQGLIQCAAAGVKSALAERASMQRIAARALERLALVQTRVGPVFLGVDLRVFSAAFGDFARDVPEEFDTRPRLRLLMPER